MTYTELGLPVSDPVRRAKIADDMLWSVPAGRLPIRDERDNAVREALETGSSPAHIAAELGILATDVLRMADESSGRLVKA